MGFLAPWFLAGALAVGLPVYVHLLRRHKTIPLPFSSLMFFERGTQSSTKHRRLRYLLLFSLRSAFILLLALAFAAPFMRRPASPAKDRLLLIVVDRSLSMRAGSRLDQARREALKILAMRHSGQKAQIMALGSQLESLTQPIEDAAALQAAVNAIQPGDERGNFGELGRGIRALAQTVPSGIDLHFISDMQRSGVPANFADMVMPDGVRLQLHPVATATEPNWTVANVDAPTQVADTKQARVRAVIAGFNTPAASRTVSLLIDGKVIAAKSVQIPANGSATAEFAGLDVPYGLSRCAVRVEGADALPADNARLFAVRRADPEHILLVRSASDTRTQVYLAAAIAAASRGAYLLQSMTPEAVSQSDPSRYAFVILADIPNLPPFFENGLKRYVNGGGNVLQLVGSSAGRRGKLPLLGAATVEPHVYARTSGALGVADLDATYPALRENTGWTDARFDFAAAVDPTGARVAARLTDGTPLLLDYPLGEGHVMLLASGLDNLTNDLPLTPAFVPFIDQATRYLSGTERLSGSRAVDDFVPLRAGLSPANQSASQNAVSVVAPDGSRPLTLAQAAAAQSVQLTSAGFYQIHYANGRDGLIGVNPDVRESNLELLPPDVQALWSGSSNSSTAVASEPTRTEPSLVRVSLWWYVMLIVLALALAESIVAGNYLGTQREEA
jgi:hypothetical protein